ncbi:MAG: putative peptidoglycan glycosyltransferase FtsW [Eubacteriales bacterium]|nr:putative peptidoglycan glycosyltransferase FtsW [Eubacteriales bacterium]
MSNKKKNTKKKKKPFHSDFYDFNLVAVIILLTCFGLIMLYSTSAYNARVDYEGDDMYLLKRQALFSIVSIIVALGISKVDYHILKHFTVILYVLAAGLMFLVLTPLGVEVNGAKRWVKILGVQFQPSEIAKIAVIICIAYMVTQMGKKVRTFKACVVLLGTGGLLAVITLVVTNNLSTAIIIMGITAGMVFLAHPNTKVFLIIAGSIFSVAALTILIISLTIQESDNFRIRRILAWIHPEEYADGYSYQTVQALYAIGSGGFFGKGLGNSIQKLGSVPEAQNDMIFSIVCEELGVFGAFLILALFFYLLYRLFFIASNAPDMFGSLLVSGVFIHIALQVILNVSVVVNFIPNTGVTLPFFSYGGTSSFFLMAEMGMALSVARRIKFREPQDAPEQLKSSV